MNPLFVGYLIGVFIGLIVVGWKYETINMNSDDRFIALMCAFVWPFIILGWVVYGLIQVLHVPLVIGGWLARQYKLRTKQ